MNQLSNRNGSAVVTLPNDTDIHIVRQFDAPAALVFKATTTPELVKRWWGFESAEWAVCDIDLRVGGGWRYVVARRRHGGRLPRRVPRARSAPSASCPPRCSRASPTPRR